jgi:hypothetical protein
MLREEDFRRSDADKSCSRSGSFLRVERRRFSEPKASVVRVAEGAAQTVIPAAKARPDAEGHQPRPRPSCSCRRLRLPSSGGSSTTDKPRSESAAVADLHGPSHAVYGIDLSPLRSSWSRRMRTIYRLLSPSGVLLVAGPRTPPDGAPKGITGLPAAGLESPGEGSFPGRSRRRVAGFGFRSASNEPFDSFRLKLIHLHHGVTSRSL